MFGKLHNKFEAKWGKKEATTFLTDKLNEIVQRRHVVAHSAQALNITRTQLNESVKFLRILGELFDKALMDHINAVIKGKIP